MDGLLKMKTNKIAAGIVLFNPEIKRFDGVLSSVYNQVDQIYLFDNKSDNLNDIETIIKKYNSRKITLIKGYRNFGIGYALNRICESAISDGYDFLLSLDHDTLCKDGLTNIYRTYLSLESMGILCPQVVDDKMAINYWASNNSTGVDKIDYCIQSGCLLNLYVWKSVNGFDEDMFIDFVDFDYCMRLHINGYCIYRCNEAVINHQLGDKEKTKIADFSDHLSDVTKLKALKYFGYKNVVSPKRAYYTSRNNIIFIRKYKKYLNMPDEIRKYFDRNLRRVIRSKNGIGLIKDIYLGLIDGLKYNINS